MGCEMTPSNPLRTLAGFRDVMPAPSRLKDTVTQFTGAGRTAAVEPARAVAFYAAIALPFVYLPLLANGVTTGQLTVLVGLLLANAAALVLGHGYGSR